MALKVLPPWGRPLPNSTSGSALRTNFLLRAAYGCLRARGAWLVNQSIGFGALHYPISASTVAWGSVIGAAALAATAASAAALRALPLNRTPLVLGLTLICAYGAYELALLAATPFLGGAGAFTIAIVARLGLLNLAWLIGLVMACEIVRLLNPFGRGRAVST